ncbi:hypothetical protein [Eubacterium limosum]|uniref:Phage protein n=1 Tax=Eubacterium limosum TaxID=1736 RepID=A0ABT5UTV0_EUBLI|nr:hypothetical protein [Eubacterium limosum]MDE1472316.1 hypothetical protein [Eubacterium limosum]
MTIEEKIKKRKEECEGKVQAMLNCHKRGGKLNKAEGLAYDLLLDEISWLEKLLGR